MWLWTALLVGATMFVAYANGANDNFKGVATLFGSGTTDYRKALWWATGATLAGSLAALFLATTLVQTFQGQGLVPPHPGSIEAVPRGRDPERRPHGISCNQDRGAHFDLA